MRLSQLTTLAPELVNVVVLPITERDLDTGRESLVYFWEEHGGPRWGLDRPPITYPTREDAIDAAINCLFKGVNV